ncbi:MAG: aspartate aminotransferase family protein [Deltaproteobacteria bacterium]|nr:aspartate aminotransferase family protein [Deltaproteobacteria bacterium]
MKIVAEMGKADSGAMRADGQAEDRVLAELEQLAKEDVDWRSGRILTGLYDPGGPAYRLTAEAYSRFLTQNALYINMYPSAGRMEQDVVRSLVELLRGDDQVVGNMTSGGTESIMLAVKTARDHAREHRPGVVDPEMVVPITAHPAFHKAAQYLGLRLVVTPVETEGFRADVDAFRAALGPNVVLGVGSAPNFSHGTIDPIDEMAAAAKERGILFHVDACVGGIYLPFLRRLGEVSRAFDFTVEGVTSISADMHKYGYAPKNASVLLYRNRELRKHALFVCSGTTEYAVINPTVLSSKTAGPIAAAWAVLRHLGEAGYERIVRESWEATRALLEGIEKIEGVEVLAKPDMCMFTLGSEEINIFELDDEMRQRGWLLLPQFACGGGPANLHISISTSNVPHVDRLLSDLGEAVGELLSRGPSVDRAAMAREVAAVVDRPLEEIFARLIGLAGLTGEGLPERMAPLNTVLGFLPSETRDQILAAYINAT